MTLDELTTSKSHSRAVGGSLGSVQIDRHARRNATVSGGLPGVEWIFIQVGIDPRMCLGCSASAREVKNDPSDLVFIYYDFWSIPN